MGKSEAWPAVLVCWHTKTEEAFRDFCEGRLPVHQPDRKRVHRGAEVLLVSERGALLGMARVASETGGVLSVDVIWRATTVADAPALPSDLATPLRGLAEEKARQPVTGFAIPPEPGDSALTREWLQTVLTFVPAQGQEPEISPATGAPNRSRKVKREKGKDARKRSPLRGKPLRYPGQSTDELIDEHVLDRAFFYILFAAFVAFWAFSAWYRRLITLPGEHIVFTVAAIVVVPFCVWRVLKLRRVLARMRQGCNGEKIVGQMLEDLRENGYKVFHDLVGPDFNVDHLLIGPGGVFAIETKTISKPRRGPAEVTFDGQRAIVGGHTPDRDPIVQAKAEAKWVAELLKSVSGKRPFVQPVVVYPGWFIRLTRPGKTDVWVMNDTQLLAEVPKLPEKLTKEDVAFFAENLKRYLTA